MWTYAPLVAMLGLRLASSSTANLSYLLVAAYALLGPAHAIRALTISWLFSMLSPGLAPEASAAAVGRYAVLFGAAASAMLHSGFFLGRPYMRPFTLGTLLLGLFIVAHSLLFSSMADVSVLKAISWALAMATLVSVWCILSYWQREQLSREIFWGLVLILLASLPLSVSSLGYLRNGTGFQGILNHPQAFGPTMALLCAWATARLFGEARPPWWLLGVAGASLGAIMMSEARTAGLAMVLAVGFAILLGPGFGGRSVRQMLPGLRSARIWGVLGVVLAAGVFMAPTIGKMAQNYISKSGRAQVDGLLAAYDRSRGGLINSMLDNIAEYPLTGIGFGIASEPALMVVARDPILGLPVGASIEKGVTPLMVIEELGIFGALLVAFWVFHLLRSASRSSLAPLAVCLTVLLLNMGEATLFSPGGFGLLPLILLGWAYASDASTRGIGHG
ncbi:hypothetical protein [Aquamicrobium soli]|uniref:O-antigen ligase domain-containing protein n=1 Tax=Aquamicrobium soli TaxID=1811518 RepID=A0ABV7KAE3_9HYPH